MRTDYEIAAREARVRLEQAYTELTRALVQVQRLRTSLLEPAQRLNDLTRRSFAAGEASVLALIDAANSYFDAQTRYVELLARAWGEEGYLKAAEQARSELADAQARLSALEASIEEQRALADVSLLDAARRHGVEAIWAEATANERRALARFAIRRIEVAAPPRRRMDVRQVTVELRGGLESVTVRIRDVYLHYMTRRAKERKEE